MRGLPRVESVQRTAPVILLLLAGAVEAAGDPEETRVRFTDDRDHRVNWRLSAREIQENFNPAPGFVNRRGIRQYDGAFRYRTRPHYQPRDGQEVLLKLSYTLRF